MVNSLSKQGFLIGGPPLGLPNFYISFEPLSSIIVDDNDNLNNFSNATVDTRQNPIDNLNNVSARIASISYALRAKHALDFLSSFCMTLMFCILVVPFSCDFCSLYRIYFYCSAILSYTIAQGTSFLLSLRSKFFEKCLHIFHMMRFLNGHVRRFAEFFHVKKILNLKVNKPFQGENVQAQANAIEFTKLTKNLTIPGKIAGKSFLFLCDTGASHSVINSQVYNKFKDIISLQTMDDNSTLRSVNGHDIKLDDLRSITCAL